jgi:predicted 3-demethylubiquinone-9 3-methyltransferase (glyoxalase superfamily)
MQQPSISTCLWMDGDAEVPARFYCSLFDGAEVTRVVRDKSGAAFTAAFTLLGQHYWILNGGPHFQLTPAASITVEVETQDEIDRLWQALLADGGTESRCGWLTDRFGLSWQIVPRVLPSLLANDTAGKVMQAMMGMVKLDIAALQAAAN